MNPYEPSPIDDERRPRHRIFFLFYAITAYLVYMCVVVINLGGPVELVSQYSRSPIGLFVEAFMMLAASGMAAFAGGFWLDARITKASAIISRTIGGFAFGTTFVTCQTYVFHRYCSDLLTPLEKTLFGSIARFYAMMFTQPYIIIPTVIFSGIVAWIIERLWRGLFSQCTSDEPRIAPKLQ